MPFFLVRDVGLLLPWVAGVSKPINCHREDAISLVICAEDKGCWFIGRVAECSFLVVIIAEEDGLLSNTRGCGCCCNLSCCCGCGCCFRG
jgi:hypothetical protein